MRIPMIIIEELNKIERERRAAPLLELTIETLMDPPVAGHLSSQQPPRSQDQDDPFVVNFTIN